MRRLQELYWESQKIHDQLAAIESRMRKLTVRGKSCIKTQAKYIELLDELREVNAHMSLIEENGMETPYNSRLIRSGESILITCA